MAISHTSSSSYDCSKNGNRQCVLSYLKLDRLTQRNFQHNGSPPTTYAEKQEFKKSVLKMRKKSDEENFEEAEAQAYRAWTTTTVPSETRELFSDPKVLALSPTSAPFFHLVHALSKFVEEQPSHNLPLTSTLPDMKASTGSYIHLQKLYKARAEEEKAAFKSYLQAPVSEDMVDAFVKNSHALKLLRGKKWGALDADPQALGTLLWRFRFWWIC
jgi:amyloid beta precursor protein binding protein 1